MTTRRKFIKSAALGSAVISAGSGFSVLDAGGCAGNEKTKDEATSVRSASDLSFPGWEATFDERASTLLLKNGSVTVQGLVSFVSGKDTWTVSKSRDRLANRYTILDTQGNVQGYFECHANCGQLNVLFYHRSGMNYTGTFSFQGKVNFLPDSFACLTRGRADERVLFLACGRADSRVNDSLFSPESDTALLMRASDLHIKTERAGAYAFYMAGRIDKSLNEAFIFSLETGYFKKRHVPYYHPIDRKRCPRAPTGWMSWNTYFDQATADDNLAEARIGKKYLQPFGCDIWHIESWQGNSDKLPVSNFYNMNLETSEKKFPKGMKQLADDIKKLGFRPGIWMAPFGTGNKEFYEAHRDWFVHDQDGKAVSCWNGRYTLDPTVPEALAHMKHIHRIASQEWGYEYFKIDGMSGRGPSYGAHFYERPEIRARLKDPSNLNPYEDCLKAFREGIGEDRIWLACGGHVTGPDPLYVDAARIAGDVVHPDQPVVWEGVLNQGRCTLNRIFTNNIVGYTDPDTLLVRDLTLEEARVAATIVALPGQLTFFADKLAGLTGERMKLLQQTLPVADVLPLCLYPSFTMLPIWNLSVRNSFLGDYNIVALFNWTDESSKLSFTSDEIGVDSGAEYILYEFWTEKGIGTIRGSFAMEVPAHAVRLLAMHNLQGIPQWLSSDRHIAQNGLELKEYRWNLTSRTLEGRIQLIGSFPLTMRVHVPQGYRAGRADCTGAKCNAVLAANNVLDVTFLSNETGVYPFAIRF